GERLGDASCLASGPRARAALDAFLKKWFPESPLAITSANGPNIEPEANTTSDDAVLRIMFDAKDGARSRAIFEGDVLTYPSQSEADLALCGKLRFYSRGDAAQIDRLFRRSGLMRAKWDERRGPETYGAITITKTIVKGGPVYTARIRGDDARARDAKERRAFGKVPLWWVVRLGGVGELACRVLSVIASYADAKSGEAFPSVATIAAHLRVSERRVKTALAVLKAAGLLEATRRPRKSNLYRLALTVPEVITPYAKRRQARRVTDSGHVGCPPHGTRRDHEETNVYTGEGGGA
ncbi:MAG: helix-turn-helix domain-containing protein, partial [Candidatus Baltobacteraceae bacterium]